MEKPKCFHSEVKQLGMSERVACEDCEIVWHSYSSYVRERKVVLEKN